MTTPPPLVTTGRALLRVGRAQLAAAARRLSPFARDGSVAICVCPHGTYEAIDGAAAELLDELERPRLFETLLERTDGAIARPDVAQRYAQEAVVRLCRRTAPRWSEVGARVLSVTVGPLDTVQGRMRLRRPGAGGVGPQRRPAAARVALRDRRGGRLADVSGRGERQRDGVGRRRRFVGGGGAPDRRRARLARVSAYAVALMSHLGSD